jgi:type I restriction enzyme S subunit
MTDMSRLKPYEKYNSVNYDYVSQLPIGWELLPNIAIFQERKEKGGIKMETLSVSAIKGIVKASDYDDRKDRTSDDKSEYLIVHEGDIPYNTMLMWAGAVGRSEYKGIVSPAYTVLQPKSKVKINTKYFHYMFRSQYYKNYSKRFSYGIVDSRLRLYYTYFKRMYSIVPPLETQNAIVNYLDRKTQQIQEFIAKKERLIELLEEKRKVVISTRLSFKEGAKTYDTKIDWIGEIPDNWKVLNLKYLLKAKLKYGANEEAKDANINEPRYIRITDFGFDGKLHEDTFRSLPLKKAKDYLLEEGDILFARSGATVGKAFQFKNYNGVACFAGYLIKATPKENEILSDFLYLYTQSSFFETWKSQTFNQATIENIGADKYAVLKVIVPPIAYQSEIIKQAKNDNLQFEKVISKAQIEIEKAKEYQESLITQVVSGQLKVPEKTYSNVHYREFDMVAEQGSYYHT